MSNKSTNEVRRSVEDTNKPRLQSNDTVFDLTGLLEVAKRKWQRATEISLLHTFDVAIGKREVLRWSDDPFNHKNFGDALNPSLFAKITSKHIASARTIINLTKRDQFYFIGSILDNLNQKNAIVCGAGFQYASATITTPPKKILFVRGPKTQQKFESLGITSPKIYGDPALALPIMIDGSTQKTHDIGIIAHYADKQELAKRRITASGYSFRSINIEDDISEVVNQITSCKYILSSSLHGVIVAHAYAIPAAWIKFSENVLGGTFKFDDYFESVGLTTKIYNVPPDELDLAHGLTYTSTPTTSHIAEEICEILKTFVNKR